MEESREADENNHVKRGVPFPNPARGQAGESSAGRDHGRRNVVGVRTAGRLGQTPARARVRTATRVQANARAKARTTPRFQIEEATIDEVHRAIQLGRTTCTDVIRAYVDRARAYNGMCTQLVTADGAAIPRAPGTIRAGDPLSFPTATTAVSKVLPQFDQYGGPASITAACRRPNPTPWCSSSTEWSSASRIPARSTR